MYGPPLPPEVGRIDPSLFRLVARGEVYDLSSGWWPGMPLAPGHPPMQVFTFRTPAGERAQGDLAFLEDNSSNFGFISEVVSFCTHSGTHIDALAHITSGPDDSWYGGHPAARYLGDFGPMTHDATTLPAYLCRGVLIDAPGVMGSEALEAHTPIDAELIRAALDRQNVELHSGDAVLLRTGTMRYWPDVDAMEQVRGAGLSYDGAELLAHFSPSVIGSDNAIVEVEPSGRPGEPQPVHRLMIRDLGVPLMEWVNLEQLAKAGVYEFLFIAAPLRIAGATGSLIRPLALT
jgi:kynurenine formamidase